MLKKVIALVIMGLLVVGSVSCGEKDNGTVAVIGEHAQKCEFDYAETVGNIVFCGNSIKMIFMQNMQKVKINMLSSRGQAKIQKILLK
ncbi:MAG: hypothetical protein K2N27_05930 [Ruminococcus sp.]|nr:hypothetical protein [Ruminococcus sp.]